MRLSIVGQGYIFRIGGQWDERMNGHRWTHTDGRDGEKNGPRVNFLKVSAAAWSTKMLEIVADELTPSPAVPVDKIYKHVKAAYRGGDPKAIAY